MGSDEGANTTGMVQDQQRTAPVTKCGTSQMRMKIMTESRMLAGQGTEACTQSQASLHHQPATAWPGAAWGMKSSLERRANEEEPQDRDDPG